MTPWKVTGKAPLGGYSIQETDGKPYGKLIAWVMDRDDAAAVAALPETRALLQTIANYSHAAWADNADQQRSAFALSARELLARMQKKVPE